MPKITSSFGDNEKSGKERKEILFKGYFYDITHFIWKHPGGDVIQFYTEPGEDATQAIAQFHFRSRTKVEMMMKSFARRPATPSEMNLHGKEVTRHDEMSKDFRKLFEQLEEEGYFEPSYRHVTLRFLESVSTYLLTLGLVLYSPQKYWTKFVAAVFAGFALNRFIWLQHEGGHRSLTGHTKVDHLLQNLSMNLFAGFSSVWFNTAHNRHHAMPQRVHHDVDLSSLPVFTFTTKEVTSKSEFFGFLMKYQGYIYWTVYLFFLPIYWKFYLHPLAQLRKKAYLEMLLNIPSYFLMFQVGIGWYFVITYFMAIFLELNVALSHSHLEVTEESTTHWIEYAFTHTANIRGSMLCDWWMGYLNYQIEHHLFPTMPEFRQSQICERVKALAEKHGLPYFVYGYSEACRLAMKNLSDVGKELSEKDWDACKEYGKNR